MKAAEKEMMRLTVTDSMLEQLSDYHSDDSSFESVDGAAVMEQKKQAAPVEGTFGAEMQDKLIEWFGEDFR